MNDFERTLVKSCNTYFAESKTLTLAYRLKQSRFAPQFIDVLVDSASPDLYLGIECKSISVDKGASALYFSQHFTIDKNGKHQIKRISDFLEKSGRRGYLAVELRMGGGHTRQAYLVPWAVVEKQYKESVKLPVKMIKTHSRLERRGKTYNVNHLYKPLRRDSNGS
jgi:hypothetical protein